MKLAKPFLRMPGLIHVPPSSNPPQDADWWAQEALAGWPSAKANSIHQTSKADTATERSSSWGWGFSSVVQCLPSKCKVLGLVLLTRKVFGTLPGLQTGFPYNSNDCDSRHHLQQQQGYCLSDVSLGNYHWAYLHESRYNGTLHT